MTQGMICAASLLLYLLLCGTALLAGLGLLRLGKIQLPARQAALLAPVLALLFWTLTLGLTGALRIPVKAVAPWLWGATLALVFVAWRRARPALHSAGPLLLYCAALPVVVMAGYFWNGLSDYAGSIAPDGWAYVAGGQYMWTYPRGTEGGLEPLYQFASIFNDSRYISFSLLAFFSPLVRAGETQGARALLQAWSLFTMTCAVGLFWVTLRPKTWVLLAGTGLATVAGWIANLIWANNLDNGLALAYLPALAGVINLLDPRNWRWWVLLGSLFAGIFFTYPELAFFIMAGAALIALPRLVRERSIWLTWLRGIGIALAVAALVSLPAANDLLFFMKEQWRLTQVNQNQGRAGAGLFHGVVMSKYRLAAFWGLGGEHQVQEFNRVRKILGAMLALLMMAGLVALARRQQWGLAATTLLLTLGTCYLIFWQGYSYGAYKLIVLNWWCLAAAVVMGADWFLSQLRAIRLQALAGAVLVCMVVLMMLLTWVTRESFAILYIYSPNEKLRMAEFRKVGQVNAIAGRRPLMLAVDDWLASVWAVYFLRDRPTYVGLPRMYLANPGPNEVMKRSRIPALQDISYLLTDARFDARSDTPHIAQLLWTGGPYRLWRFKRPVWAFLTDIKNGKGISVWDDQSSFWMASGDTRMEVMVNKAGTLHLECAVLPGAAIPGWHPRQLLISTRVGYRDSHFLPGNKLSLSVPVQAGRNTLVLHPQDPVLNLDRRQKFQGLPVMGLQRIQMSLKADDCNSQRQAREPARSERAKKSHLAKLRLSVIDGRCPVPDCASGGTKRAALVPELGNSSSASRIENEVALDDPRSHHYLIFPRLPHRRLAPLHALPDRSARGAVYLYGVLTDKETHHGHPGPDPAPAAPGP